MEWNLKPLDIETQSFATIKAEAGEHTWSPAEWTVIQRLVHTSADFDYVADTIISSGAIAAGVAALKAGSTIITDTQMARHGISPARLKAFGNKVYCLIGEEDTYRLAEQNGTTRALAAVDLAYERYFPSQGDGGIWVVGNAPTALFRLLERLANEPELPRPNLIVGLPVGFVNAVESKEALSKSGLNFITNRGRKGGSNVAATVVNALAVLAQ